MKTEYLEITASAEGRKPSVRGMAYSGGKMRLFGWSKPVVVDMAGMTVPESVPLLANHENHTLGRVGLVAAKVVDGHLEISGEIVGTGELSEAIVAQGKAGADWQLSIGAEVEAAELVQEGKRTINGVEHDAPFYHVTKSTLREVSVVAVGADKATHMKVTASLKLKGNSIMEPEINGTGNGEQGTGTPVTAQKPTTEKPTPTGVEAGAAIETAVDVEAVAQAAVKAERERVGMVKSVCGGEFPEIEAKAIAEGWNREQVSEAVLAAYREKQPKTDVNITIKKENAMTAKHLEAALSLRAGIDGDTLVKSMGEETVEAAMKDMDMPLRVVLGECMRIEGMNVPRSFDNDAIKAAFSTVSLPGILSNVANKKLLQAYNAQPIIATRLCTTGDLTDFKENQRFRLTDVGDLQPVGADGEIKDSALTEEAAKNQLDTYAKKFCLTRKMIINDDLGAFLKVPTAMGNRAARLVDQLFFKRLMSNPTCVDGKPLFGRDHKNLLSGANSALSADSLKKAIQMFIDQTDADGQPISVEPSILLVPTALKHLAIELTRGATLMMSGGADNTIRPAINVLADENLAIVSSPYLGNRNYPNYSEASWYLFGKPGTVDTFEIGYLKGKRTPTVERGDLDFNVLGVWFRVYFDIGIREQDHRGMVKATGTAS
ncbi:MAG: Mu-like prophage major head subunit gpT family protein [Kiritimatiellae bacterium]|nr:Mu-like prophage major head subunit gpT family protein [Kiritimatiellia bacterium]